MISNLLNASWYELESGQKQGGIFGRKEEHCGPTLTEKRDANLNPGMH